MDGPHMLVAASFRELEILSVEKDSVAVLPSVGRLQQCHFIVKMKRAHHDARHRCDLLDRVCHRLLVHRPR